MGELQLLFLTLWVMYLSPLILVLAAAVHILFSRQRRRTPHGQIAGYGLLAATLVLFAAYAFSFVYMSTSEPICAGVGDPNVTYCQGYGFVPHEQAAAITRLILLREIGLYIVLPTLVGASILAVLLWFFDRTNPGSSQANNTLRSDA